MGTKLMEAMRRKTKDLFIVKRLLARAITKLQKVLITREGDLAFKFYYKLAEMHFRLHYGFSLRAAIKTIGGPGISNASSLYAAQRHARLYINANPAIKAEGGKTLKYYSEAAANAFIHNLSK